MQLLEMVKGVPTLGWTRPSNDGGDRIQGYIIEYKKVGDGAHWEKYNTKPIDDLKAKSKINN